MDLLTPNQQKKSDNKVIFGILISLSLVCLIALFAIGAVLKIDKPDNNNPYTYTPGEYSTLEEKIANQGKINKFASLDELQSYLENNTSQGSGFFGMDFGSNMRMVEQTADFAVAPMAIDGVATNEMKGEATGIGSGGGGGQEFSTTNIQVTGVDEADIIKTDGEYIYMVSGRIIYIVDAVPANEMNTLAEIEFNTNPLNIYINDNKLAVFGYDNSFFDDYKFDFIIPRSTYTYFKVYDISDKSNPKLERELNFEGSYVNSRMIGDYVYFLTSKYPNVFAEDIMPRVIDGDQLLCAENDLEDTRCPGVFYFNIPHPSYQMTTVAAIDITKPNKDIKRDVYLMSTSNNIYVSTEALYITNTKYLDEHQLAMEVTLEIVEPRLNENLKAKIAKIRATDNDVLNDQEKMQKINTAIQYYIGTLSSEEQRDVAEEVEEKVKQKYQDLEAELEKTIIHKITIDKDKMESAAQGEVPGTVLNQFSMDENDGYFRIATTRNSRWSRFLDERQESYNNMYVLDKDLKIVGRLEHLAQDERIYSVRFMQDRAYMVTFQQIDPLFVIDLSNPNDPKVLGELKIPGFSNYLHPYDNTTLIGLGQDTKINEWGAVRTQGVKLSLFDVSDVANPTEIDNYIVSEPNSNSIAQNDHKAFLFNKDKELLVIPVSAWGDRSYNGAMIFKVTKQGFEFRKTINHSSSETDGPRYNRYNAQVKRSLYIGDELYTMSDQYLKVNNLNTLDNTNTLELQDEPYYPEPMPMPIDVMIDEAF